MPDSLSNDINSLQTLTEQLIKAVDEENWQETEAIQRQRSQLLQYIVNQDLSSLEKTYTVMLQVIAQQEKTLSKKMEEVFSQVKEQLKVQQHSQKAMKAYGNK